MIISFNMHGLSARWLELLVNAMMHIAGVMTIVMLLLYCQNTF